MRGKVKPATASEPVEGPWVLPAGWRWERLGQLVPLSYGKALKATDRGQSGKIPVYGSAGVTGSHDSALCHESSIIVGRKGSAGSVYYSDGPSFSIDTAYFCPRSAAKIDLRLAYHLLTYSNLRKLDQSTAVPSLGRDTYNDIIVPVPPKDEQARLARRIDELFSEIDDGEAALERARGDLATWRKALLKAAVTGELTADWRAANPPTETGADLLARILAERRTHWLAQPRNKGKRYAEPAGPDTTDLSELPREWTWATVGQLGEVVTGATPATADPDHYTGDIPFFTPGDLDAGFRLSSTKRTISQKGINGIRPIPARSVLVTCIGATIGKVGFNSEAGATNQQINSIIPLVPSLARYIFHYFDGPGRHLVIDGSSSTTMPILNKGDFMRLAIPLPPLNEAQKIATLVEAQNDQGSEAACDTADCRLASTTLRQSILAAAFRGDLVA